MEDHLSFSLRVSVSILFFPSLFSLYTPISYLRSQLNHPPPPPPLVPRHLVLSHFFTGMQFKHRRLHSFEGHQFLPPPTAGDRKEEKKKNPLMATSTTTHAREHKRRRLRNGHTGGREAKAERQATPTSDRRRRVRATRPVRKSLPGVAEE